MKSYSNFASIYDKLMSDVNYSELVLSLLNLCKQHNHIPRLVLDAACGTGSLSLELAKNGLEVIGVDLSEDMLLIAKEKLQNHNVLLICQDLCDLDLYGTVDTSFCTLDSINHITDKRKLKAAFKKIALFTEPGGLFIFDVNTEYKHKNILSDNTFVIEDEDIYLVWQNERYSNNMVNINLDFFIKTGDLYNRKSECFFERAYSDNEIYDISLYAGFEIIDKRDFDTMERPHKTSEKIVYVARKI